MKHIFRFALLLLASIQIASAQERITPKHPDYDRLKAAGQLPENNGIGGIYKSTNGEIKQISSIPSTDHVIQYGKSASEEERSATCNCFQQIDSTFQIAPFDIGTAPEYRNDDGSTDTIQLPFEYCLYGDTYTSCFINNNGNISFNEQVGGFSSAAFPNTYVMVAPFWADVDTRGAASGLVYYKITEHYMVVIWDNVGYFSSQTDKRNSFQLIISDGTDPIVPFGNNTAFCYSDMQWTTGSASNGVGGFGGIPATSGANRGNSTNFIQFGQFGQAGGTYQGPFGNNSGIDWLDNRSFFFNTCTDGISTNVPPVLIQSSICETAYLCVGSQASFDLSFFAVEEGQSCSIALSPSDLPGLTIVDNTSGNIANIAGYIDALPENIGTQQLTFTVTDDGNPAGVTELVLTIEIVDNNFVPVITSNPDSICAGTCATLSVGSFDTYLWSTGETTPTIQACSPDEVYTCTVTIATCTGTSDPFSVPAASIIPPVITGDPTACIGNQSTLTANAGYTSYNWSNGQFGSSISVNPGTYILTVTNSGGCSASDTFTVTLSPGPEPVISTLDSTVCTGQTTFLSVQQGFDTYLWTGLAVGDTNQVTVGSGSFTVTVIDTLGCQGSTTFVVTQDPDPIPVIVGDNITCFDETSTISCPASYNTYTWSDGSTQPFVTTTQGTFTVTVQDNNGCIGVSAPFTITNSAPTANVLGIINFCEGDSIELVADGNYSSYAWFNTPVDSTPIDTLSTNDSLYYSGGNLSLLVEDAFGCIDTVNVQVPSTPSPAAAFTRVPAENTVYVNTEIVFTDASIPAANDPINSWDWNLTPPNTDYTSPSFSVTYPDTGIKYITLIVTSDLGCIDTTSSFVYIVDDPFVPNVFSPDGDGYNDFLRIPFLAGFPGNTVVIFNRWGKKVYEATDYKDDWDGGDLPSGTYFYVVNAPNMKNELKGSVTIMRK
ncbi:MAG: hypothetical protein RLZZ543_1790 [Bacteroidota bacterium]|jgi:gliding motility-associated-like protein